MIVTDLCRVLLKVFNAVCLFGFSVFYDERGERREWMVGRKKGRNVDEAIAVTIAFYSRRKEWHEVKSLEVGGGVMVTLSFCMAKGL